MLDPGLLKILVCPKCKSEVEIQTDKIVCKNPDCGLKYFIKDNIPVMLTSEAGE